MELCLKLGMVKVDIAIVTLTRKISRGFVLSAYPLPHPSPKEYENWGSMSKVHAENHELLACVAAK